MSSETVLIQPDIFSTDIAEVFHGNLVYVFYTVKIITKYSMAKVSVLDPDYLKDFVLIILSFCNIYLNLSVEYINRHIIKNFFTESLANSVHGI